MIDDGYEAFSDVVTLVIELIRQFYQLPRQFRLLGAMGREEFVSYDGQGLREQVMDDGTGVCYRVPEFDLEVSAQDENPYKTMEYNQLALQLFQMGFFREDMADQALRCLELMDFKNKDQLTAAILQGKQQAAMAQTAEGVASGGGTAVKQTAMERMRQQTHEAVRPPMIRAVFGRDRVTVTGHAGYAPKGQDIVCGGIGAGICPDRQPAAGGEPAGGSHPTGVCDGGGQGAVPGGAGAGAVRTGAAGGAVSPMRRGGGELQIGS